MIPSLSPLGRWLTALAGFGLALLLVITLQRPSPAALPGLPLDINQHWAANCLTGLAQRGWIGADAQGRFYPDDPMIWGDYVALLNRVIPPGSAANGANPLEQALGLATTPTVGAHLPDHLYQRDLPLGRAEAVMALAAKRGSNHQLVAHSLVQASLVDGAQVPAYTREGVAAALAQGLVVNYPEANRLRPTQILTRGEGAALACRLAPDLGPTLNSAWIAAVPPQVTLPMARRELRGVWLTNIDSQVLFSTAALTSAIDQLAELHFNTLYPTVWNWGYTLYPSPTAERELGARQHLYADLSTPQLEASQGDRDLLQEAIDLGHGRGMAVIPWFEFGFMAPADYSLYRRHPDWFTQRQASPLAGRSAGLARLARQKQGGDSPLTDPGIWMEGNVIPRRWLNPFHPQVQKFLLELIDDLVSHYAVDGCQFDDHLGLPIDFGYDPYTVNLYRMEHNGQAPPANPKDPEWVAWRARKISDFLILVNKLVKARRPQAVLSISPNPYPWSYQNYLQDWPTWVNLGLVDELVVQVYRSDQNRFIWEMTNPSLQAALARVPTSIGLLSGLRANPVRVEHLRDQIYALRDRRLAGMSFFFYESLWLPPSRESRAQRLATLEQVLSPPLPRPR